MLENEPVETFVSSVYATDLDAGTNAEIRYEISPRGHFQIDAITGNITIGVEVDREGSNQHTLTVFAKDLGDPIRFTSTLLNIQVRDVNDEAPTFDTDIFIVNVLENHTCNNPITNTSAYDKDEPGTNNSNVSYKIIE